MRTINLDKQLEGMGDLKALLQSKGARIRDLGQGQECYIEYDMNSEATNNAVFKLIIKNAGPHHEPVEVIFYKEQMTRIMNAV